MRIKKLLADKKGKIFTISPDASVYDALKMMKKEKSDALVVVEKEKVLGILSKGAGCFHDTSTSALMRFDPNTEMRQRRMYFLSVFKIV